MPLSRMPFENPQDLQSAALSGNDSTEQLRDFVAKVPAITVGFWVVKVLATTLGETGGDSLSMSMGLGYLTSTLIFAVVFVAAVVLQIRAARFNQWVYWFTIIATTTLGTTIADYVDRDLGVGYPGGTTILSAACPAPSARGSRPPAPIAVPAVRPPRREPFSGL